MNSFIGTVLVLVFVLSFSCGAPAETAPMESMSELKSMPATAAPAKAPAVKTVEIDETAQKAALYCEHEVKKSLETPLEGLTRKHISACMMSMRPVLSKECASDIKKEITLKIIIASDGSVTGCFATGASADFPEAQCVSEKVKEITFPAFVGEEPLIIEKYPCTLK